MTAFGLEPGEGYVALEFLDPEPTSHARPKPVDNDDIDAIPALCVGIGRDVSVCQRGDTVMVRPHARNGVKVGSNVVLAEAYCVVRKLELQ
jgi:hypothetical protein